MITHLTYKRTAEGRPESQNQDGDIGAMAEPAGSCLEVASINNVKSPGAPVHAPLSGVAISERSQDRLLGDRSPSGQCEISPTAITEGEVIEVIKETNKRNTPLSDTTEEPDTTVLIKERKTYWSRIGNKHGVRVATFNIRGKEDGVVQNSKYKRLTTLIRKNTIAVLAIQESRLNNEWKDNLMKENPRITIVSSDDNTRKGGVAFVINNDVLGDRVWKHTCLIKGRASRLEIEWSADNRLDILNVYVPNANALQSQINFFKELKLKLSEQENTNQLMIVGDFNFVEDRIDRLPHRGDSQQITDEMNQLKKKYKLIDGWRLSNPHVKEYTFYQDGSGSKSRIDRIYINKEMFRYTYKWEIMSSAGLSDHDITYVEILKRNQPFIGKGSWNMKINMIEHPSFYKKAREILKETEKELEEYKEETYLAPNLEIENIRQRRNPQSIWIKMKDKIRTEAIQETKNRNKELRKEIKDMKQKMKCLTRSLNENNERKNTEDLTRLRTRMALVEEKNIEKLRRRAEARYRTLGENCTKYWFNLNKPRREKECILALEDTEGFLTAQTKEMVGIASLYHKRLQASPMWSDARKKQTKELLDLVDVKLGENEKRILENCITEEEVRIALKKSKNGRSPGCDGIPYEFWKKWTISENKRQESDPDLIKMMTLVFQDIEEYGVVQEGLTSAMMSLLYKKKDKRKIENYRPITLLNTDYKTYTKTIAKKLGIIAPVIIDPNQAGFVPGRGLYDHVRTTQAAIEYSELMGSNGCIISLDQEKAYDKIDHTYLWEVLRKYDFPEIAIKRIKALYTKARTTVYLNGVPGKPVKIQRGVRQGDPMSCLLYNIAIEPLANAIRKSDLQGLKIPNLNKRLLVSLFADDTLVYLNHKDEMKELKKVLDLFCGASTAKFNHEKTEYLMIGSELFRHRAIKNRRFGQNTLNQRDKIIQEGEAMRTLGAWVGNNSNTETQWNGILNDQRKILEVWAKMNLSFKGKELVLKALVQSKALFLATVNGMPEDVMHVMHKQMKDFVWNGKPKGDMAWHTVIKDKAEGGLAMPDLKARLDAIQIIWLKRWLSAGAERPIWAYITDSIIADNVGKEPMVDDESRIHWILQTWHESMSDRSRISPTIRKMLKIARKYNAGFEATKLDVDVKEELPVWFHLATTKNYIWNKKGAKCLRHNHRIRNVGQLVHFIRSDNEVPECDSNPACKAVARKIVDLLPEKFNPNKSTPVHDNLDHTPRRLNQYKNLNELTQEIQFNPDVTERENAMAAIRIFRTGNTYKKRKNKDTRHLPPSYRGEGLNNHERIILYTDGSASKNGSCNGLGGIGVYHEENSPYNRSLQVTPGIQTNQRAELMAVIAAVQSEKHKRLLVKSDSESTLKGITQRLRHWEDIDWIDVKYKKEWQYLVYLLRTRTAETTFQWVKSHSGIQGNEMADKLANEGRLSASYFEPPLVVEERFRVNGARLQSLTQKRAYKLIIKGSDKGQLTNRALQNIEDAQDEIERITDLRPSQGTLWLGLQKNNNGIQNKVKDFIWKIIHARIKCGSFFQYIPGLEERQFCTCGQVESIDHILLYCEESGIKELWLDMGLMWNQITKETWIQPTIGIIRGLGALLFETDDNKTKMEDTLLYRTIVSETCWTIWKMRNKKIFEKKEMSFNELKTAWTATMIKLIHSEYEKIQIVKYEKRESLARNFERIWCRNNILAEIKDKELRVHI